MSRPIRVRIGELVLHGFDPRDRHAIANAVHDELARAFSNPHAFSREQGDASIDRLDAGSLAVQPRAPRGIGAQVARSVKGALRR